MPLNVIKMKTPQIQLQITFYLRESRNWKLLQNTFKKTYLDNSI